MNSVVEPLFVYLFWKYKITITLCLYKNCLSTLIDTTFCESVFFYGLNVIYLVPFGSSVMFCVKGMHFSAYLFEKFSKGK